MSTGAVLLILALTSARRSPGSQPKRHARSPRVLLILLSLPGALGGIVVALLLMRLFSLTPFSLVLDTPVPLVLGVSLLLLPPALLLRGLFDAAAPSTAVHLAHLMAQGQPTQRRAGRAILWRLRGRSWFWLGAVLFALAYFELVVSVTLAPIGMTPAIVELYNQMHYGQRALLSAGVVAAMLVPAAVLAVCALAARWTPPFDPPPT
ncbi:MAG TPA: hypothetical protein DEB06_03130, partial [Phycisphaerales bacterium]|nr:hypothetical protein [Phycisphaerales bacterium]